MAEPVPNDVDPAREAALLDLQKKRLELRALERDLGKSAFRSPLSTSLVATLVAGLLGLWSTSYVASENNKAALRLEALKSKNQLIIEAVKTGVQNPDVANQNINFFLDAGLIDDPGGKIRKLVSLQRGPVLPRGADETEKCSVDATTLNAEKLVATFEGEKPDTAQLNRLRTAIRGQAGQASKAQIEALTSVAYNVGLANVQRSNVMKQLKGGHVQEAADAILKWDHAAGRAIPGLHRRRVCERELFLTES